MSHRGVLALSLALIAGGCGTDVKVSDAFAYEEHMTPERQRLSPETRAKVDAAMERSRRAIEEHAYGKPIVSTLSAPTGPMIVPGSRVTLLIEATDMGHGVAMEPATIAMFVPTPTPNESPPNTWCHPCLAVQRARGMNETSSLALPYVVRQRLPAFLEDQRFYTMGVGGVYEVPETHQAIHGDGAMVPRPPHARTGDPGVASRPPKLKVTVLSTCKADVRRVEIRYMEWDQGWIPLPKGYRNDRWNEFHGCKA
jgi:hypothetical protein